MRRNIAVLIPKYMPVQILSKEYIVQNTRTSTVVAGPYKTMEQAVRVCANLNK